MGSQNNQKTSRAVKYDQYSIKNVKDVLIIHWNKTNLKNCRYILYDR